MNGRFVRDGKQRATYSASRVLAAEPLSSLPLPPTPYRFVYRDAPYQHLVGGKGLSSAHVQRTIEYLEERISPAPSPEFPIPPRISCRPPPLPLRPRNRVFAENFVRYSTTHPRNLSETTRSVQGQAKQSGDHEPSTSKGKKT